MITSNAADRLRTQCIERSGFWKSEGREGGLVKGCIFEEGWRPDGRQKELEYVSDRCP